MTYSNAAVKRYHCEIVGSLRRQAIETSHFHRPRSFFAPSPFRCSLSLSLSYLSAFPFSFYLTLFREVDDRSVVVLLARKIVLDVEGGERASQEKVEKYRERERNEEASSWAMIDRAAGRYIESEWRRWQTVIVKTRARARATKGWAYKLTYFMCDIYRC